MQRGYCLCGHIQYEFDASQLKGAFHCHCKDCQRVTGSGKATVALFPQSAVEIVGDYKIFTSLGSGGSRVNRGFCPCCGSQMFTFVDEIPGMVFIKAGGMVDSSWLVVNQTCWTKSATNWLPPDNRTSIDLENPLPNSRA